MKVIKNSFFFYTVIFLTGILLYACNSAKEEVNRVKTIENHESTLLTASINAHGGLDRWKDIASLTYSKTTILFDSAGNEESNTRQKHDYQFKPEFAGTISWESGSDKIEIRYNSEEAWKIVNNAVQETREDSISATNTVAASHFVLFQPFKLSEVTTQELEPASIDGITLNTIQPIFGNEDEGGDMWWFYINQETNLVQANMVRHNGRYSIIKNLEFDSDTPFVFHKHRKSFFCDSLQNITYLRAEYFYNDYEVDF